MSKPQNQILNKPQLHDDNDPITSDLFRAHIGVDKVRALCVDAVSQHAGERPESSAAFSIVSVGFRDEDQFTIMSPFHPQEDKQTLIKHLEAALTQLKGSVNH